MQLGLQRPSRVEKDFSCDWTTAHVPTWRRVLARWRFRKVQVLEIGCWEGRSTIFFLSFLRRSTITCIDTFRGTESLLNLPEHQSWAREVRFVEARFDHNVRPFSDRVEKIKAESSAGLDRLIGAHRSYDLIYVDGSHRAEDVRADSARAWHLLRGGGIMIWDDYTWRPKYPPSERPKDAIDEFLNAHAGSYDLLEKGNQVIVRRRRNEDANRRSGRVPRWPFGIVNHFRARVRKDMSKIHARVLDDKYVSSQRLTALEKMVIVIEDRRFFQHAGVDFRSVLREVSKALLRRKHGGASTIDMQFVRTVTNYRDRTLARKLYESLLAMLIQRRYSKRAILRSYLACAYFGTRLNSARSAAEVVFEKKPDQLDLEEAAFLAALLACPRPRAAPPEWEKRARRRAAYALTVYQSHAMRHFRRQFAGDDVDRLTIPGARPVPEVGAPD